MQHRTALTLAPALLGLVACSSGSDPSPAVPPAGTIAPLSLVYFSAEDPVLGTRELWASAVTDQGPSSLVRLHEPLNPGDRVDAQQSSLAGERVAYHTLELDGGGDTGRLWTIDRAELVELMNDPGTSIDDVLQEVGGPLATGESILDFQLTPDGSSILYRMQGSQGIGLYMVDLMGSEPGPPSDLRVGSGPSASTDVGLWALSPDGTRVAWLAHDQGSTDLILRDLIGTDNDPVMVNPVTGSGSPVAEFEFGPLSASLAYVQLEAGRRDAWYVNAPMGSEPDARPVPFPPGVRAEVLGLGFSSAGTHLRLSARSLDGSQPLGAPGEGEFLAVSDVSGEVPGDGENLSGILPAGSQISWTTWAVDDSYLLYLADPTLAGMPELFWVGSPTATPTAPVVVNDDLPAGAQVHRRVPPTLAGPHVLYRSDQYTAGEIVLMQALVADVLPGTPSQLSPDGPTGGAGASGHVVAAPDGESAMYVGEIETAGEPELFLTPVGSTPAPLDPEDSGLQHTKLNPPLQAGGQVSGAPLFDTTGKYIVFRADVDGDGAGELYLVRLDSEGIPLDAELISDGLPAGFGVREGYTITP